MIFNFEMPSIVCSPYCVKLLDISIKEDIRICLFLITYLYPMVGWSLLMVHYTMMGSKII